jgi:hypothetical protein
LRTVVVRPLIRFGTPPLLVLLLLALLGGVVWGIVALVHWLW